MVKAVVFEQFGGPEVLKVINDFQLPAAEPDEVCSNIFPAEDMRSLDRALSTRVLSTRWVCGIHAFGAFNAAGFLAIGA